MIYYIKNSYCFIKFPKILYLWIRKIIAPHYGFIMSNVIDIFVQDYLLQT